MEKRGEAAREESSSLVDEILSRGQAQRQEMQGYIQREISEALAKINMATRDDLARLERRIQALEVMVEDLRGAKADTPSEKTETDAASAPAAEPTS
jgi:polyhydroxyalkanoate synthesis regulator phasin